MTGMKATSYQRVVQLSPTYGKVFQDDFIWTCTKYFVAGQSTGTLKRMAQTQRYSTRIAISIRKISSKVGMRIIAHTALVGANVWVVHSPITVSFPMEDRVCGNLDSPEDGIQLLL